jgi:HAD superfamily hydrolase (TIGR01509 family)
MTDRRIEAIVFDCDGVLVDSEETSCGATADLLARLGFPMSDEELKARFLGKSIDAVYAHYLATTGRPLPTTFADDKESLYIERARGTLRAMPGALEVVSAFHRRLPIAVATSGGRRKVEFSLRETGLGRYFEVVVASVDVARGKPFPDLFLRAAQRLEVAPATCAVIEDSRPGIEAALAAGMYAIGLSNSLPEGTLVEAGAHVVVDRLEAVLRLPMLAHLELR